MPLRGTVLDRKLPPAAPDDELTPAALDELEALLDRGSQPTMLVASAGPSRATKSIELEPCRRELGGIIAANLTASASE